MLIMIPGIYGSGAAHWHTFWEASEPSARRLEPQSWDFPDLADWTASLDRAVLAADKPAILVAHSLGCLLVAHWAARGASPIAGAFLVSPPDPDGPNFPAAAVSFRAPPAVRLSFPSLVVASLDDRYAALDVMRGHASAWRSGFVVAGALGHINEDSALGDWPQGRALLEAFRAGVG